MDVKRHRYTLDRAYLTRSRGLNVPAKSHVWTIPRTTTLPAQFFEKRSFIRDKITKRFAKGPVPTRVHRHESRRNFVSRDRNLSFKRRERSVGTSREVVLLKIDGGNKETPARASEKKSIYLSLSFSRQIIIAFCKFFKNIIVEEIGNRKGRQREI